MVQPAKDRMRDNFSKPLDRACAGRVPRRRYHGREGRWRKAQSRNKMAAKLEIGAPPNHRDNGSDDCVGPHMTRSGNEYE